MWVVTSMQTRTAGLSFLAWGIMVKNPTLAPFWELDYGRGFVGAEQDSWCLCPKSTGGSRLTRTKMRVSESPTRYFPSDILIMGNWMGQVQRLTRCWTCGQKGWVLTRVPGKAPGAATPTFIPIFIPIPLHAHSYHLVEVVEVPWFSGGPRQGPI